jgi:hypothetical protein
MKKLILITAIIAIIFVQNHFAQDSTNQHLQKVLVAYLIVKNDLVADNVKDLQKDAEALYIAISNVTPEKLTGEQNKIWGQYSDKMLKNADHIKSVDEIEHQREHFAKLSVNFYEVLENLNFNTIEIYYQYCPMKKSYWVSEKSEIENPYYGIAMLTCGSTKETISVKK